MSKKSKRILIVLGGVLLLAVVAVVAIPMLVDVNRYRGLIEDEARQALGREVRLGEMKLSLFPTIAVRVDDVAVGGLPGEGGDLLTARSLRVGARLLPLLRKRLEVTTIVVRSPRVSLVRTTDGGWNVQRLLATPPADAEPGAASAGGSPEFRIGRVRLKDGRVEIRDESRPGEPSSMTLTDLDLTLSDVRPDGPVGFELATSWAEVPQAKIRIAGSAGPLVREEGESLEIVAEATVSRVDTGRLTAMVERFYPVPEGLIGGESVSVKGKLDVAAAPMRRIAVSDASVEGLELALVQRKDGTWNLPLGQQASTSDNVASTAAGPSRVELRVDGLELRDVRLVVRGEPLAGRSLDLTIDDLDARLDRLPLEEPAALTVSASFAGGGRLSVEGEVGPLGAGDDDTPFDLSVSLDPVPASLVGLLAAEGFRLDAGSGRATVSATLSGAAPREIRADGRLALDGYRVDWQAPDGKQRTLEMQLAADYDVVAVDAGRRIRLDELAVALRDSRVELLGLRGERCDGARRRSRAAADHHRGRRSDGAAGHGRRPAAGLVRVRASDRARGDDRGACRPGRMPSIRGVVELEQFTFMHDSLSQPLTEVAARVALDGQTIRVERMTGVVGSSDFDAQVHVRGFTAPQVEFELDSRRADFGELFSFLRTEETAEGPAAESPAAEDPLAGLRMDGRVRIGSGRFDTLEFRDLDARMSWVDGVLTLDPVTLALYDGRFSGDVVGDLSGGQPVFSIRGDARAIDIDRFLADNLGSAGLLYGRFSGHVETTTVGADYETIVRELKGSGKVDIEEGRIAGLDVLETLSRVSGLFGEDTLRSLGSRLAQEGTSFQAMSGGVRFDGGKMRFDPVVVDSTDFKLSGDGAVDLIAARLDGKFRLSLSPEISASMRAEESRAGELFWNGSNRRVEVPFGLEGPFDAPSPTVDWNAVAETAVRGRVEDELRKYLTDRLGGEREQAEPPTPTPTTPPADSLASSGASPSPDVPPAPADGPVVQMTKIGWGGSFLLPDLEMEGKVSGERIASAEIRVVDARGKEIQSERVGDVQRFLDKVADRSQHLSIPFKYEVDGKKMALAAFPVSVRVTALDESGGRTEQVFEVEQR